jgi:molybdate transport system ATP-binding protein
MIKVDITKKLSGAGGPLHLTFNTTVAEGEFVTLFGPSGAGKTSVLRMLAGLVKPDTGTISVNDQVWFDGNSQRNVRPQDRNVGMVFQEYALFPNMTVRENLEFALPNGQAATSVAEMLDVIELSQLANVKPSHLSGGQKQRVALGRALLRQPRVLLLDEPFSAVDISMQLRLNEYLRQVLSAKRLTTILVSHDMATVMQLSHRVIILENGSILREGIANEVLPLASLRSLIR